jgi:Alpha/beta hydrolase
MVTALTIVLLLAVGPTAEPAAVGSPGDGLGLASNSQAPVPAAAPPTTPAIPLPAAGLGGLAAIAGLAAGRAGPGRRSSRGESRQDDFPALLYVDGAGDGQVAFRVGPADASHVAIYVPGTGADLASAFDVGLQRVRNLRAAARLADPTATVAVIYALPFDAPDHVVWDPFSFDCACNGAAAEVGAGRLTDFVAAQGLGGSDVTVIGYSYGSTVVGKALADEGLAQHVDRVVLVGSPGVGVDHSDQLNLPAGAVFAAQAGGDVIDFAPRLSPIGVGVALPGLGGLLSGAAWAFADAALNDRLTHGTDPTSPQFGATVVRSGDHGHGDYFDDVEHLEGIGRVVVARDP